MGLRNLLLILYLEICMVIMGYATSEIDKVALPITEYATQKKYMYTGRYIILRIAQNRYERIETLMWGRIFYLSTDECMLPRPINDTP